MPGLARQERRLRAGAFVHHYDGPYTSGEFTQALDDNLATCSLDTTGHGFGNALAESIVDSVKAALIAGRAWRSIEQGGLEIVEWVRWFNPALFIPRPRHPASGVLGSSTGSGSMPSRRRTFKPLPRIELKE